MRGCGHTKHLDRIGIHSPNNKNQIPWIVQLVVRVQRENSFARSVYCGGSIISKSVILTAAHCFFKDTETEPRILYVQVNYNTTAQEAGPYKLADRLQIHPKYTSVREGYDIALLHVEEPLPLDEFVRPVCLPEEDIEVENKQVLDAGWGIHHFREPVYHLMYVFLRALSPYECREDFQNEDMKELVVNMLICTRTYGKDVCTGASGGPLTLLNGRRWVQVGITSSGQDCNKDGEPSVYTRVSLFTNWIKDSLKNPELWKKRL
ncbi:plasma kallikrein-like [Haemaphysalis longicornis]